MFLHKSILSRRKMLALTGAAAGSGLLPAMAKHHGSGGAGLAPPSFTLFYKPEKTGNIWDTWVYYHKGRHHLYYNPSPRDRTELGGWNGIALATSEDGVHWNEHGMVAEPVPGLVGNGSGAVWRVGDKFITNSSEWFGGDDTQTIYFFESENLIDWRRLSSDYKFDQDERWYEARGRWDNIWAIPRPGGGFYGYWCATPKNNEIGVGFGESDDGVHWRALPPAKLEGLPQWPADFAALEVGAAYHHQGRNYLLVGLNDLNPMTSKEKNASGAEVSVTRFAVTTMVSDAPGGPFQPAKKNRRLLVSNSSAYFMRFVDIGGGDVLANHHSWEVDPSKRFGADPDRSYLAPLKKVEWDEEGTLRLKWWKGNDKAKDRRVELTQNLIETAFNPDETLILEGKMSLSCSGASGSGAAGIYLQGAGDKGTGFLVRAGGLVEFGDINRDGSGFVKRGYVDRELTFGDKVRFRFIRKGRLTEFYLNDHLMQCYALPERGTGRIGLIGRSEDFRKLKAWYCA